MGLLRKNYKGMSDDQKNRFVNALKQLKNKGVVDNFAQIHAKWFTLGIHRTSHFLPWHREMLYRFELELQKLDPSISIPYWDSTADNSPSSPLWDKDFLGGFNSDWNLNRALGAPNTHLPTLQQVQTDHGQPTYPAFWDGPDGLEIAIHNPPHAWVGGEMGSAYSPRDPAFYLHHCWIDMLWAWWQNSGHGGPQNFVPSTPTWRSWGLYDPLLEWSDRTPANVINYHWDLGYRYDIVDHNMWVGDVLYPSDYQFSYLGGYMLMFRNGILGFETSDQKSLLWQSTQASTPGNRCILEYDGNLAIYDDTNNKKKVWESNTHYAPPNSGLRLTPEGKFGIYGPLGEPLNPPWSRPPPPAG
jgi:Common central domain of tyrosinase